VRHVKPPKAALLEAIDAYVVACGGTVESQEAREFKPKVLSALFNYVDDERSDAEEDGRDEGYSDGSRDAKDAKAEAEESRKKAVIADDTLSRVLDRLGWDKFDRLKFEQTGVFPARKEVP
jgi:hypothetical protein